MPLIPRQTYSEGEKVSKIDHVKNEHPCDTLILMIGSVCSEKSLNRKR